MRAFIMPYLVAIFGAGLVVFGCTATQKNAATTALNATTQPIQNVQDAASTVATATPPGSLPNDIAQIVMAITGSLLVLERTVNTVIQNLPTKTTTPTAPATDPLAGAVATANTVAAAVDSIKIVSPAPKPA